jgi:hypothetical protein
VYPGIPDAVVVVVVGRVVLGGTVVVVVGLVVLGGTVVVGAVVVVLGAVVAVVASGALVVVVLDGPALEPQPAAAIVAKAITARKGIVVGRCRILQPSPR